LREIEVLLGDFSDVTDLLEVHGSTNRKRKQIGLIG